MQLDEIVSGIYHGLFDTQLELCSTLVRFQEHYESPEFQGKVFTLQEFKKWYTANSPKGKETGKFTYYTDWAGFNLPDYVFVPFRQGLFNPLSKKERGLLAKLPDAEKFYFIGTFKGKDSEYCLRHEVAHGLFYLRPEYKRDALSIIREIPAEDQNKIRAQLTEMGYGGNVLDDEMHAYTLDASESFDADFGLSDGTIKASEKLKALFSGFAPGHLIKE